MNGISFAHARIDWRGRFIRFFIESSGSLLLITALAKLVSSFGAAGILIRPDPVLGISFGHLFQITAVLELVVAGVCFFNKNQKIQTGCITLLASVFLSYRIALNWLGYHGLCPCLGNLTDALHISPEITNLAMEVVLAYLLVGGFVAIFLVNTSFTKK